MPHPQANATTIGGARVRVVLIDPPFAYARQAVIEYYEDGPEVRVLLADLTLDQNPGHAPVRNGDYDRDSHDGCDVCAEQRRRRDA